MSSPRSLLTATTESPFGLWHSCFRHFRQPRIQDRDTAWFHRGEPDPHPRKFAGIRDPALGDKSRSVVRDSDCYFRSLRERSRRLNKTPEQTQVLRVRSDLGLAVEGGYLNPSGEREASRAMGLERDSGTSVVLRFYSKWGEGERKRTHAGSDLVNTPARAGKPI
jgi:hypothetical protein